MKDVITLATCDMKDKDFNVPGHLIYPEALREHNKLVFNLNTNIINFPVELATLKHMLHDLNGKHKCVKKIIILYEDDEAI